MCKCIRDITNKMVGRQINNKTVKKAEMVTAAILIDANSLQTVSTIECSLEGQKKPHKKMLIHKYCPFCGEEYPRNPSQMKPIPQS
jgi:hypothetical protein